ncbi:MAG TPA: TetR/AcrR family transcriptional regulator [Tangfeifania sp.]|nr:TetR/AcrR family transcriptional regulator [Tangfeifania sp.]
MPRSSEQFDDIRKQKKKLIMDTALELFAENGFHATSISQIAKKAGISKGLTYNYFKSKDEILDQIVKTGFDSIYSHFDLNHDGVLTTEEFKYFIRKSLDVISDNKRFWKLYTMLLMQSDLAESVIKKYSNSSAFINQTIKKFIESKGSKDPEGDLMIISSLLKGASMFIISAPDYFPAKELEEKIIDASFRIINNQNSKAVSYENDTEKKA